MSEDKTPQKPDLRLVPVRGGKDPRTGLTPKQEAFAQGVARDGLSYSEAYRRAYEVAADTKPVTVWTDASALAAKPDVALRMEEIADEIRRETSANAATRAERVLRTLEELMATAPTPAARLKAAELLGKTVGLYRDVSETVDSGGETLAEMEARLAKLLRRDAG